VLQRYDFIRTAFVNSAPLHSIVFILMKVSELAEVVNVKLKARVAYEYTLILADGN
jgi:hypothetical protein